MVTLQCQNCGKDFTLQCPSMAVNRKYCSKACIPYERRKKVPGRITKSCEICGKEFQVWTSGVRRKVCSIACRAVLRVKTERGELQQRSCIICGKEFLVAKIGKKWSRHAGCASKRFCSRPCRVAAKYRTTDKCANLQPDVAAYLAGFWDGEGSIMLIHKGNGAKMLRVTATNTYYEVLSWLRSVCDIGNVVKKPRMAAHHKQGWTWQIHGEGAETFLQQLLPYLRVKREQARLALAFQARLRDPSMKADRAWQEEWRQQMKALMREESPITPNLLRA